MRFLVDANLPPLLAGLIKARGCEAIHTSSLPAGNATADSILLSLDYQYVIVSKDSDFYESFLLRGIPYKLIFVRVGNMRGKALIQLFESQIDRLLDLLSQYDCVELHANKIIIID